MARAKATFGGIRRLPSGRYQARYSGPDLVRHTAPITFDSKGDAETWLALRYITPTTVRSWYADMGQGHPDQPSARLRAATRHPGDRRPTSGAPAHPNGFTASARRRWPNSRCWWPRCRRGIG